jgi:hypothetical protein
MQWDIISLQCNIKAMEKLSSYKKWNKNYTREFSEIDMYVTKSLNRLPVTQLSVYLNIFQNKEQTFESLET